MNVEHILQAKGRHVLTIEPGRSLAEAARALTERKIGAVVVTGPDQSVLGILSERDIVRAVARGGAGALESPVAQHMTGKVVTCTRQSTINELMEVMTERKFRHMPIVENGRLCGIISIGDVVKNRVAEIEAESQALREYIATA
ncbi:MAG: inosine-5-monophosphate dehydrogenase [Microvirga sp.]|jgi:CBS domain-containing protein|nr:inosine-5-monophosphate dehydrogenase [Microvirga sp.]